MQIVKPNWVIHEDDKGNPQTIYSVHVHPDGTRLATGSIQNVIKIWSTAPILDQALESVGDEAAARLLCRMEGHDGAVLCVRWACSGRFLATSSDDAIIMVWFRSTAGNPTKSFGSKVANIEDWKPWKRLAGHTSDVTGVAWAHDDQYLASVGLDNLVLIWDCYDSTFTLLKRLDQHQGFVKGVVWDPVGQYLATQSDDRTVKIWRTNDWQLEADIKQPFVDCPTSTFFRRLSWSPDGAHIVTPNAMNGPVFVSAVIDRDQWTSTISLVGHENVVEVASYNPHMFLKDKTKPPDGPNICAALALGARNSISIWLTNSSTPILVLHDVFDRDILDLSWAADGVTLYACSSEGHVAAFVIHEIMSIINLASPEAKAKYHQTYAYVKPARRPRQLLPSGEPSRFMSPLPAVEPYRSGSTPQPPSYRGNQSIVSHPSVDQAQQMTIMPNGKRRIKPVFLGQSEATMISGYSSVQPNGYATPNEHSQLNPAPLPTSFLRDQIHPSYALGATRDHRSHLPFPSSSRVPLEVNQGSHSGLASRVVHTSTDWNSQCGWRQVSPLQRSLNVTTSCAEQHLRLECSNTEDPSVVHSAQIRLLSTDTSQELWSQTYYGRQVACVALNASYAAIGFVDGTLSVYTITGRLALPTIVLDSACGVVQLAAHLLMAITSNGTIMIWDVNRGKSTGPSIQMADLGVPRQSIMSSSLTSNGVLVVNVDRGTSYTFDRDLMTWILLTKDSVSVQMPDQLLHAIESNFQGAMAVGESDALEITLYMYLEHLMKTRSLAKMDEFCSELWAGKGALFGSVSDPSSARWKLVREDRIQLLKDVVAYLSRDNIFRPICDEYRLLLRHVQ